MNQPVRTRSSPPLSLHLLVVVVLLFPLFGLVSDHHFAEREPGHAHPVAFGLAAPAYHVHFYQVDHLHTEVKRAGPGPSAPVLGRLAQRLLRARAALEAAEPQVVPVIAAPANVDLPAAGLAFSAALPSLALGCGASHVQLLTPPAPAAHPSPALQPLLPPPRIPVA